MIELVEAVADVEELDIEISDTISINSKTILKSDIDKIISVAKELKPWRKGPFCLFENIIDAEWLSYKKFDILKEHFSLNGKSVADVGCNNGYYMFRLLEYNPREIVGFDPSKDFFLQFHFLNKFIKSNITYELSGVEELPKYGKLFDVILCLGVLYHRAHPIGTLKALRNSTVRGGELFLDTLVLDQKSEFCLFPEKSYQKMSNSFFIPTVVTLTNWLLRAGFVDIEILDVVRTTVKEQRRTDWIYGESLEDFLDKENPSFTVEGYPAPTRAYIKCRRK
jgi:tRNA (mo5U34)-methyltransferase